MDLESLSRIQMENSQSLILAALLIGSFNTKWGHAAIGASNLSSVLPLPTGFNHTLASLLNSYMYGTQVYGYESMYGTQVYGYEPNSYMHGTMFVPVLSSSAYINRTRSNDGYGFAFGILVTNYFYDYNFVVCGGFLGDTSLSYLSEVEPDYTFQQTYDGYCVPLWLLDTGGRKINNSHASLEVITSSEDDLPELQLRDGTSMLWSVKDVGRMKMLDNGSLVIYDSKLTKVVWNAYAINNSSVLLPRQKLMLGEQLISKDSIYSLRLHTEGLSLNLNDIKYHDSSYLFLPFNDNDTAHSVCNESSTYITYITDYTQMFKLQPDITTLSSLTPFLLARSCSRIGENGSVFVLQITLNSRAKVFNFSFVTLGTDGYLYLVGATASLGSLYTETYKFTYAGVTGSEVDIYYDFGFFQEQLWLGCEAPMVCGPMSVCTTGAQSPCSCPSLGKVFTFYNDSNQVQGCKRILALRDCNTSSSSSSKSKSDEISFLQLNHTGSILLLSQSPHFKYDLFGSIDQCKINCSSTCECQGFFFDPNVLPKGGCYFITEDVGSLLNISVYAYDGNPLSKAFNTSLSTFLKIVSTPSQDKVNIKIVSTPSQNKINIKLIVLIITSVLISSFLILSGLAFVLQRKRRKLRTLQILEERELQNIIPSMVTRFSYKDLHKSTHGFNDSNILGVGGCGAVYKGVLADRRLVAIKMLGFSNVLTKEQTKQFLAELACVSSTSHYNIVRLLGFCWENSQLLVVYEYLQRGSLDQWLFNPKTSPPLDWKTRYDMTIGITQGMQYLHEQCTKPILHLDVKPQNILLDQDFVPKLADFGLSKLVNQRDISQVITGVRGTPGYIAPEWVSHGAVSKKADVYSMGMVLLEIVSGRRNVDLSFLDNNMDTEKWYFPCWAARKCEQGLMTEIIDEELQGAFDDKEVQRVVFTAFWCINEDPCVRPSMGLVLQWLNGVSPITTPNFSSIYAHERSLMKPPLRPSQLIEFDSHDLIPFLSSSTNPIALNPNI